LKVLLTDNWIKCLGRHITDYNTHNCRVFSFTTWLLSYRSWRSYSIEYCWSIIMAKLIFYAAVASLLFNLNFSSSFFHVMLSQCTVKRNARPIFFILFLRLFCWINHNIWETKRYFISRDILEMKCWWRSYFWWMYITHLVLWIRQKKCETSKEFIDVRLWCLLKNWRVP
jgi:hypothetical protein